jgi:hypothetical protein
MPADEELASWDDEALKNAIGRAADGIIEAEGVLLVAEQLGALLQVIPESHEPEGEDDEPPDGDDACDEQFSRLLHEARFKSTTFAGDVSFARLTFTDFADFANTTFSGKVSFAGATFQADARFEGATFAKDVDFSGATFGRSVSGVTFAKATFAGNADFASATFHGDARFQRAMLEGRADFSRATFASSASFGAMFALATFGSEALFFGTSFRSNASFHQTTFRAFAMFDNARFDAEAGFQGAVFEGSATFDDTKFSGDADFGTKTIYPAATFLRDVRFHGATFASGARFRGAIFRRNVDFGRDSVFPGATFGGLADFAEVVFAENASFREVLFTADACFAEASFEKAKLVGPILVQGFLDFGRAVFVEPVKIEIVIAQRLSLDSAVFRGGVDVFASRTKMSLEDAEFAATSLIAELPPQHPGDARRRHPDDAPSLAEAMLSQLEKSPADTRPRLVSIRRAKVAHLTISGADLQACRFAGAHGLDSMKVERVRLAPPPVGRRRIGRRRPMRWMPRQTIAEEQHWRKRQHHGSGWYVNDVRAPDWLRDSGPPLEAEQVAVVYRALRKGREDSKDEPGAADFYYGEMEMRRYGATNAERATIWLYWLVAGYGLRASRALIALAATIAVLAVGLDLWGFRPDKPYGRALLFAVESSVSLLRAPTAALTASGEVIQIVLRLAGPLLFGLALVSLRGRIKR